MAAWTPNRREALMSLGALALAGCGGDTQTPAPTPRVAVIGGGLAGVATAWFIEQHVSVDLFEARSAVGGNVRTLEVEVAGQPVAIDLGAQYFHPRVYPTYERLLTQLGVVVPGDASQGAVHVVPSSVTMTRMGQPLFVSPILPSRLWPLSEAWNRDAVSAFTTFAEAARKLDAEDTDWSLTVEQWLPTIGVSTEISEGILLPWIAGINSGVMGPTRGFSARAATIFLGRALGEGRLENTTYSTLNAGMGAVINALVAEAPGMTVLTSQLVLGIERRAQGLMVVTAGQTRGPYTQVVLALPGPQGGALLAGLPGLDATTRALNQVETFEATLALHRDPIYAHPDPTYRSLLNAEVRETTCEVSMSMADALAPLPDGSKVDLWKSWVGHREREPQELLSRETYTHIQISPTTLQAQATLAGLQGEGDLYFAGGWTLPFDAQETALLSAMTVAEALAPESERLAGLRA